jgi:hypothetical protein
LAHGLKVRLSDTDRFDYVVHTEWGQTRMASTTKKPSVMETHIGRFHRGDAHDKTSRKQSGPGCESNADSPWIGDDSLLVQMPPVFF